jgi:uncharacterized protein YodC (DUF2158 family)
MTSINIGDVVRLKSGGPLMTVKTFTTANVFSAPEAPKDHVQCQWFDEKQICKIGRFAVSALEPNRSSQIPS